MRIVIRSATISDANSPYDGKRRNVLIDSGYIEDISTRIMDADKTIDAKGMILSTGWFDMGTSIGDPGFEYKEDITSATKAAASGGFTEIAMLPDTDPPTQSKNGINYLVKGNKDRIVQIYPMASVTLGNEGNELTDMVDLDRSGAVAFTDGLKPIWNTDILLRSLQYLQQFDGLLIDRPEDRWITLHGQMNEGVNSVKLGLKGMPKIAEEIAINRDIELLRYAGGRLHLTRISSPKAVRLVGNAKKSGLKISCDIAAYQALLDDSLLENFDTNYKVYPPLREKSSLKSIIKGLQNDTIDVLVSGHCPQDVESKVTEFDRAEFGLINLQTFAAQIATLSNYVEMNQLIHKITTAPRKLLSIAIPTIEVGAKANLTLFDPNKEWHFTPACNKSKSDNSPWLGKKMRGKAKAVFNNAKYQING